LKSGEKKNPYEIGFHQRGCPEFIWDSPSELIGFEEVRERKCDACRHEWKLWHEILKHTADETTEPISLYGDLAFYGLSLVSRVVDFHYRASELDPFDYFLLQIVYGEVKRRTDFLNWQLSQDK
jgi:hypothetical protein